MPIPVVVDYRVKREGNSKLVVMRVTCAGVEITGTFNVLLIGPEQVAELLHQVGKNVEANFARAAGVTQ